MFKPSKEAALAHQQAVDEVMSKAIDAMCEHYQCTSLDLELHKHKSGDPLKIILFKEAPGLAYCIKVVSNDTVALTECALSVAAEPIYLSADYVKGQ